MPTQRTLLITTASLLVMVSFLIGYISGNKVTPQGQVTAQNNSESVSGINTPLLRKSDEPAVGLAGSSYNSVYRDDEGKVYLPQQAQDKSDAYLDDLAKVNEKPEFIFKERVKAKKPYSWGSQKNLAYRNKTGSADGTIAVSPREQGDGGQYSIGQRRRFPTAARPGNLYYLPTPPPAPVASPYGMTRPMMQNPYMTYPTMPGYYQGYGR